VPQGQVALGKLTQTIAYGARTLLVRGNFDACLDLAEQARERLELYLLNSINPFRIEGQKTIVFELLQQLDWAAPDWIVLPAGNLGNTAAFGKALAEARDWGLITDTPRLAAVQAAGAAPFAASFQEGFARRHRVEPRTVASAINIGNPASYERAVRAIRETNGVVPTVTDEEILEASAASVAGARRLLRDGVIGREQRVVAVLTGHLLKDPESVTRYHQQADPRPPHANPPVEIGPTLGELERELRSRDAR
jgi:threonine synthase